MRMVKSGCLDLKKRKDDQAVKARIISLCLVLCLALPFSRIIAETDSPEERMKYLEIIESNNRICSTMSFLPS